MSAIVWDKSEERLYETGVDHGVLYAKDETGAYTKGVAWNGLTAVTESPSGAEATSLYADNIKYLNLISAEEFGGTIEAYMYPDEFKPCNGEAELAAGVSFGQQARRGFGFCYRTKVGSAENNDLGYKLHIVYNAMASVSEKAYATINDALEAMTFSWEFTTTPETVEGYTPTACVTIDSTKVDEGKLKTLEDKLYGAESAEPTLPTLEEIVTMFKAA